MHGEHQISMTKQIIHTDDVGKRTAFYVHDVNINVQRGEGASENGYLVSAYKGMSGTNLFLVGGKLTVETV
jgi:hypothetical protein